MKSKLLVGLATIFVLSSASSFSAVKPIDEIRVAVTKAIQVLKEPGTKSKHERQELVGRLETIVDPIHDFREMAKRSLGPLWKSLTPEQRGEFVPLFRDFLGKVYLGWITWRGFA